MGTETREILFIDKNGKILHRLLLDSYAAGNIQETKELLAEEMNVGPDHIRVKITGIRRGSNKKEPPLRIQLVDGKAIRNFFE